VIREMKEYDPMNDRDGKRWKEKESSQGIAVKSPFIHVLCPKQGRNVVTPRER
jgi:hypothetical protein